MVFLQNNFRCPPMLSTEQFPVTAYGSSKNVMTLRFIFSVQVMDLYVGSKPQGPGDFRHEFSVRDLY